MALWTYSDWITQTDSATRLTRLRLHIQEASERLLETQSRGLRVSGVSESYLAGLRAEENKLAASVSARSSSKIGRNRVKLANPSP